MSISSLPPVSRSDWFLERVLRQAVFKYAVPEIGFVTTATNLYRKWTQAGVQNPADPVRLAHTKESFETLGTHFETIQATEAELETLFLNPNELNAKLQSLGSSWVETTLRSKKVFAILQPENPTDEWVPFHLKLLDIFGEYETNDHGRQMIVTAHEPELPLESRLKDPLCVLFTNQAEHWQLRKKRLAWFLGRGFTVATYNGRGIGHNKSYASIEGSYDDAESAYLHFRKQFPNLCLYGNCKDSYPAFFVAKRYSVDAIFETPAPSFEQGVKNQNINSCLKTLALHRLKALHAPARSALHDRRKYPERCLGSLPGIADAVPALEERPFKLLFLANEGDTSSPPEQIDDTVQSCKAVPKAAVSSLLVPTKGTGINPHNVQSWQNAPTMNAIEKILFS